MTLATLGRAVLWWAAILVLAIANGILRDTLLVAAMGPFAALVTSGIVLSLVIVVVAYIAVPGLGSLEGSQYWLVGVAWLALTLVFELGLGLLVQQQSPSQLLRAYTFEGGNLWPVVLVVTLVSPRLAAFLRARS
jgi:hypothetical protein